MSEMVIRRTTPEDAASVSALIQCTVFETNTADYSAEIIKLICTNFTIERVVQRMAVREVFVGTIETVIVGTISFGEGRLHSMFVDPNLQRHGIGSRLVKHLEMHAGRKGCECVAAAFIDHRTRFLRTYGLCNA